MNARLKKYSLNFWSECNSAKKNKNRITEDFTYITINNPLNSASRQYFRQNRQSRGRSLGEFLYFPNSKRQNPSTHIPQQGHLQIFKSQSHSQEDFWKFDAPIVYGTRSLKTPLTRSVVFQPNLSPNVLVRDLHLNNCTDKNFSSTTDSSESH